MVLEGISANRQLLRLPRARDVDPSPPSRPDPAWGPSGAIPEVQRNVGTSYAGMPKYSALLRNFGAEWDTQGPRFVARSWSLPQQKPKYRAQLRNFEPHRSGAKIPR